MIPDCAGGAIATPPDWRRALADALRDPDALLRALGLDGCPERVAAARRAAERFGLLVPRGYLARMRPGDPDDPLLRQVLPLAEELETHPGYGPDPVGDQAARIAPGLLHKYTGRALLLATGACAVHCRYCFRRAYPHAESGTGRRHWARAFDRLAADPSIEELILSGGDPLTLTDTALAELFERAAALPRLRRLRIHTRLPVVLPERVDDGLCALLAASRLPVVMVVHANHPQELDDHVAAAMQRLRGVCRAVFNQAVLLAGVNDDVDTQAALCERLFDIGVIPYYLHMLDPVEGAHHFAVDPRRALRIMSGLQSRLPGYLLPRLVREDAGAAAKTLLWPAGAPDSDTTTRLRRTTLGG